MRILLAEDDDLLGDGVRTGLTLSGFTVDWVTTARDAAEALAGGGFAAAALDIMLPDGSGLDLLARLRNRGDNLPVLLLTARDGIHDRVTGLDAGADDYLGKPFDLDELAARMRSLVRRSSGRGDPVLRYQGLALDPGRLEVTLADGIAVSLSRREFSILHALMVRPGMIRSKANLEELVYGFQEGAESNAVEVHIHNLRTKIGAALIETVRGVGYRIRGSQC